MHADPIKTATNDVIRLKDTMIKICILFSLRQAMLISTILGSLLFFPVFAGPLTEQGPRAAMDPYIFPYFTLLYEKQSLSGQINFPVDQTQLHRDSSVLNIGSQSSGPSLSFSNLYADGQMRLRDATLGAYLGNITYSGRADTGATYPLDGSNSSSFSYGGNFALWYGIPSNYLKGISFQYSMQNSKSQNTSTDTRLPNVWRSYADSSLTTEAQYDLTALTKPCAKVDVRLEFKIGTKKETKTHLNSEDNYSSMTSEFTRSINNTNTISFSVGGISRHFGRVNFLFVNAGADFLKDAAHYNARPFLEMIFAHRFDRRPFCLYAALAPVYSVAFNLYPSWPLTPMEQIQGYSFNQSTSKFDLRAPVFITYEPFKTLSFFISIVPDILAQTDRTLYEKQYPQLYSNTQLSVANTALGLLLKPSDGLQIALVPQFSGKIFCPSMDATFRF
ncbi:MAG: hypothetical protein PHC61_05675 [Chitinivibrionales bacterium]|nr:hypothetical protein [Chitinivibrionales bacterium]